MAILDDVLSHNELRHLSAKNWALGGYFVIGLAMIVHTLILAILVAWVFPSQFLSALPKNRDVRVATLYWFYPLLMLNMLLTAGAGMPGWMICACVYQLAIFLFAFVGQWGVWHRGKHLHTSGYRRPDGVYVPGRNPDGSISDEQLKVEYDFIQQLLNRFPKEEHSEPLFKMRKRVTHFLARHNPFSVPKVDDMLKNYSHVEGRLILDLVKKYGPEPDVAELENYARRRAREPSSTNKASKDSLPVGWRNAPLPMSRPQLVVLLVSILMFLLLIMAIMLMIYLWTLPEYKLVHRHANPSSSPSFTLSCGREPYPIVEYIPQLTAKAIQLMYSWEGMATDLRLSVYVKILTQACGVNFVRFLEPGEEREVLKTEWIDRYHINMTQFIPSDYQQYSSINEWFKREINMAYRPIASPNDDNVVVSAADSRVLVYSSVNEAMRFWIKGAQFSYQELMDNERVDNDPDYFVGGSIVIFRLAPQDYHRFHLPVTGNVSSLREKESTFWSVNADAVRSGNNAFYNTRQIMVIDTGGPMQKVGFVAIGATCVGSVVMQKRGLAPDGSRTESPLVVGDRVQRGDEVGFMQFGGSTIVLLFKKGTFLPDCDLQCHSRKAVETYLNVGERVGRTNVNFDTETQCSLS